MLDGEPDLLRRRLVVLDWFFGQFHAHLDPQSIIWYEDVIESGGPALFRRLGHAGARPVALKSRNDSALYDGAVVDALLAGVAGRRRPLDPVLPPRARGHGLGMHRRHHGLRRQPRRLPP